MLHFCIKFCFIYINYNKFNNNKNILNILKKFYIVEKEWNIIYKKKKYQWTKSFTLKWIIPIIY